MIPSTLLLIHFSATSAARALNSNNETEEVTLPSRTERARAIAHIEYQHSELLLHHYFSTASKLNEPSHQNASRKTICTNDVKFAIPPTELEFKGWKHSPRRNILVMILLMREATHETIDYASAEKKRMLDRLSYIWSLYRIVKNTHTLYWLSYLLDMEIRKKLGTLSWGILSIPGRGVLCQPLDRTGTIFDTIGGAEGRIWRDKS
ncbi:uncharacterized protein KY384_007480 [Bacidia gigantensis]|uniref:uncharacterized protein n=1 Tax=Bacidia gigantensis TaxID=2732470 RepID=UPI001D03D604|nr:uncharacterized protein KY384_007480 [Bacidia gigantensis]KAG8527328.1 hypothetical protein KY384_007480 [Bacidia gigantensis]